MDRARVEILSVGVVYVLSVAIGIGMASVGNEYALDRRAAVVAGAQSSDTLIAYPERGPSARGGSGRDLRRRP